MIIIEAMKHPTCEICPKLANNTDEAVIFQTAYWRVALSSEQSYLGRAFVTLRRHAGSLPELTAEEWTDLKSVINRYEQMVRAAFGADLFNWACFMNNAFKSEQPAPHVHWHVRPRYRQAPTVNGAAYPDPNFAHHYDRAAKQFIQPEELRKIAQALTAQ